MQNSTSFIHSDRFGRQTARLTAPRIAIDENELSQRWGLSVKTLRRWRGNSLGPIFCKMGARVTYLISESGSPHSGPQRHRDGVQHSGSEHLGHSGRHRA